MKPERFGRASRAVAADGSEIWTFAAADRAIADELVDLQQRKGLGGFVALSVHEDEIRVLRASRSRTVARVSGAMPWRDALTLIRTFAAALGEQERRVAGDSTLGLDDLVVGETSYLRGDELVRSIVSGELEERSRPNPRFMPPEQSAGACWDAAARRYVLGLAAYRLLSGALPFEGESLRHDLDERAVHGAPPFAEEIARTLEPGVQSLVLRMLAARAADRPRSADEIAGECLALLEEPTIAARRPAIRAVRSPPPRTKITERSASIERAKLVTRESACSPSESSL